MLHRGYINEQDKKQESTSNSKLVNKRPVNRRKKCISDIDMYRKEIHVDICTSEVQETH